MKIVSGGQTGVDRAALDFALKSGMECGGWCPAGRLDENGRILDRYPLTEMTEGGFTERTLQNVRDSDATLIFYREKLRGGTESTMRFCIQENRPYRLIDAETMKVEEAANAIVEFLREKPIRILNVAGPRQSEWEQGYNYTFEVLHLALKKAEDRSGD